MANNAFTMVGIFNDKIGIVIHPLASLINHSCKPNAFVRFNFGSDGITMDVRAMGKIARGEEIFLSYIDETEPIYRRRGMLYDQYHFICNCVKCAKVYEGDDNPPLSECAGPPCVEETNAFKLLDNLNASDIEPEAVESIEQAICALRKKDGWSALHRQPLASLRHVLVIAYRYKNRPWSWSQAFIRHYEIDTNQDRSEYHVNRLVHQWYLIKLAAELKDHLSPEEMRYIHYPTIHWYLLEDLHRKIKPDLGLWTFADIVAKHYNTASATVDPELVASMPQSYYDQVKVLAVYCDDQLKDELENYKSRDGMYEAPGRAS